MIFCIAKSCVFLRKISIYVRNYECLMIFISVDNKVNDDLDNIEDNWWLEIKFIFI